MTKAQYTQRNQEIFHMYKVQLMTLSAIGKRMGLSRERIRQIVRKIERENV